MGEVLDRFGKPTYDWLMRRMSRVVLVFLLLVLGFALWLQFG
jgi:succinate dehydrogenase hydrophobic anchor subunit